MTYKALAFFDLDGTLLNEHAEVTQNVAEAIQQLHSNNILPIIATGRTEVEITTIKKQTNITSNIVMNGSFIRVDGKIIYNKTFSVNTLQNIYQAAMDNQDQIVFYNSLGYFATGHNEDLHKAYSFVHAALPKIDPLGFKQNPVNMLLILGQNNDDYYMSRFPELTLYRNTPYSIDVVSKGTSKGTGVKLVKQFMKMENIPTYAFGDGANDIALFEACDYKIAMGNAKPQLKQLADFVTKTNAEDGIIYALKHFNLI